MKERLKRKLTKAGIIIVLAFFYFIVLKISNFGIPCLFRIITGYKCPSCGITHMILHLTKFQFKEAFWDNPACFILLPIVLIVCIYDEYIYIKSGEQTQNNIGKIVLIICLILLLIFGIVRNITGW